MQAYLFDATFSDDLIAEIQVNPEFGSTEAEGNNNLLIPVGQGGLYLAQGEVARCQRPDARCQMPDARCEM